MKAIIEKVRDNVSKYNLGDGSPMFVHAITVKGEEYQYHSKSDVLEKFKEGEEAHFELVDKETPRGISKRIVPSQAPRQFGQSNGFSGGGKKAWVSDKDQGLITYLSCLSSVCVLNQQSSKINDFDAILKQAHAAYEEAMKHSTKS